MTYRGRARAKYTYRFETYNGHKFLVMEDRSCFNGPSLTNNIEDVVADIVDSESINPSDYLIIYQDSKGVWDGWSHERQDFVFLEGYTWEEAAADYVSKKIGR